MVEDGYPLNIAEKLAAMDPEDFGVVEKIAETAAIAHKNKMEDHMVLLEVLPPSRSTVCQTV